jgi:phage terminase Nu1 subunit (DNA packaging protein)
MLVSQKVFMELFSISRPTVKNWENSGMPVHRSGGLKTPMYHALDCLKWRFGVHYKETAEYRLYRAFESGIERCE